MESEQLSPAEFYREKIYSLVNLPTLPVIATEILRVTREDNMSVNQMLPIIEKDPPLAMKVLKIANSAYYGMRNPVKSLRHAVVVIGLQSLSNIAISFSVLDNLYNQDTALVPWKKFWKHSITCGYINQLLFDEFGLMVRENPYVLGLLHDIGKLVLYKIAPGKFLKAIRFAKEHHLSFHIAEEKIIGVTHAEIGQWIAERWKMSDILTQVIAHHHHPDRLEDSNLKKACSLVQVSDYLSNNTGMPFLDIDYPEEPEDLTGWDYLVENIPELEDSDFDEFYDQYETEFDTIREMVNLIQT